MKHSNRDTLTGEDVDGALKIQNVEPLFGFAGAEADRSSRFRFPLNGFLLPSLTIPEKFLSDFTLRDPLRVV